MLPFGIIIIITGAVSATKVQLGDTKINAINSNKSLPTATATNETIDGVANFTIPYHVSIQAIKDGMYQHLCAGTIIDESFVLTAAHCFYQIKNPKLIRLVVGSNTLSTSNVTRFNVSRIIIHDYYQPLLGRDVALLKVIPKFKFDGKNIDKINFQVAADTKGEVDAYLIGWGRPQVNVQKNLELVSFRTLDSDKCRNRGFIYVSKTELCAISYKGRGACDGDSGGPLVNTEFNVQLGILSYGKTPCMNGKIYAFTDLYPLLGWIVKSMTKFR